MSVKRAPRQIPPRRKMKALARTADGRTALARVRQEVEAGLTSDLSGDLSTAQTILVERAAMLATFCRTCEAAWLAGGVELDSSYLAAVGALRRVLATVGLERQPREIVPELQTYIASKESTS